MNDSEWKLVDRFKEPSSWAGLAAGAATFGFAIPAGWAQAVSLLGAGLCTLASILLKEKSA